MQLQVKNKAKIRVGYTMILYIFRKAKKEMIQDKDGFLPDQHKRYLTV